MALSKVWEKVTKLFFKFQKIWGDIKVITKSNKRKNFKLKINLLIFSENKEDTKIETKKKNIAYLDNIPIDKHKAKKMKVKISFDSLSIIFITKRPVIVENINKGTSVDIKKEEYVTPGINKYNKAENIPVFISLHK